MKLNVRQIRKRRIYSSEFKREMVSFFESGKFSVGELKKLYGVGSTQIYAWIYKYSMFNEKNIQVVEMKDSQFKKLQELEKKVNDLERVFSTLKLKSPHYLSKYYAVIESWGIITILITFCEQVIISFPKRVK